MSMRCSVTYPNASSAAVRRGRERRQRRPPIWATMTEQSHGASSLGDVCMGAVTTLRVARAGATLLMSPILQETVDTTTTSKPTWRGCRSRSARLRALTTPLGQALADVVTIGLLQAPIR